MNAALAIVAAVPDHVQLTLDGLNGELVTARRRCEQVEFAIASLCLVYGIDSKGVLLEAPPGPRPLTPALVLAMRAEDRLRDHRAEVAGEPARDRVLVALSQSPDSGLSIAEITRIAFPGLSRHAGARKAREVGTVVDALVQEGVVVQDDRLYRLASGAES